MSENWRIETEPDASVYAKASTPAVTEPVVLTVEEEAAAIAAKIRPLESRNYGEWQFHVGKLEAERRLLAKNQSRGYSGWEFRLAILDRALRLLGVSA